MGKSMQGAVANGLNCDIIKASSNISRAIALTFGLIPFGKV